MGDVLRLASGEVDVWYAVDDVDLDRELLAAYRALMSPAECDRYARFTFEQHRQEFLLTRALVRTVLSRYEEVEPSRWQFRFNLHGQPQLAGPSRVPLHFNLSNTKGMVVCAVTLAAEVGVDVEHLANGADLVQDAASFFSATEVAELRALPASQQRDRFFEYWTLKEAYIKARGMGLALPLDKCSFALTPAAPIRIGFAPGFDDNPASWHFQQFRPTKEHLIAAAVKSPHEAPTFTLKKTKPLRDDR